MCRCGAGAGLQERFASWGEVDDLTLERARRGEGEAFVSILRHYDRRMRVVASRFLRDRYGLDDVLQEAAIKALRGLPAFRGDAPLGAWLCRIVATICVDHLRRNGREEAADPLMLARSDVRDEQLERLDARQRLADALASLPAEQRLAVLLIDQFGYSYREAGLALEVPQGTIASRVASARASLRAALGSRREEP